MANKFDTRQSQNRVWLRKIANRTDFLSVSPNGNELDNLLNAINSELSSAFEIYPSNTPDLVLNVGANLVSNPETSIRHANPPINKQFPSLTSGSITLPASSGGSITVSPTITPAPTLIISSNAYRVGLIECDSLGNLSITLGAEAASEALALANFPGINPKAFQIGLLIIRAIGGVVQNVTGTSIIQFTGGGGSGTGATGSGIQEPITGYQWREDDNLDALITSADSKLTASGYTNATQNLAKDLYRLSCDKSRTVATSSGTGLTINLAPGFTVVQGDIVYLTSGARSGQWRRIATVNTQTNFTLDSAFSGGNAAASDTLMVSQAVWTKDLVNLGSASDKTRARDQFSGNVLQIAVDYFDSLVLDDEIADYVDVARIVVSASNSGLVSDVGVPLSNTFSAPFVRAALPAQVTDYVLSTNANQERLHLAFFPNPSNGSVTTAANLLKYEVSFFEEDNIENGGVLDSAYCYTDGAGTEINCNPAFVVASKTRIQLLWSYVGTVNPGTTAGPLTVRVDGKPIPRFVTGSTTDAYYKEIVNPLTNVYDTIELHDDFSAKNISVEIIRSEGVVDSANTNATRISVLEHPVSQSMNYSGAQFTVLTSHQIFVVAVPSFTMLVQPGRYRFNIRVMGSVGMSAGNEVSISCALSKTTVAPGSNLISQEYAVDGGLFIGGNQVTPSNPGYAILTEEITLAVATNIYFAQKHFVTSGVPGPVALGIRGDLTFSGSPGSVIEAIRIGDI